MNEMAETRLCCNVSKARKLTMVCVRVSACVHVCVCVCVRKRALFVRVCGVPGV